MKFLLHFTVTKPGFFSDTVVPSVELISADDLESAYVEQTKRANRLTRENDVIFSVTKIEPLV